MGVSALMAVSWCLPRITPFIPPAVKQEKERSFWTLTRSSVTHPGAAQLKLNVHIKQQHLNVQIKRHLRHWQRSRQFQIATQAEKTIGKMKSTALGFLRVGWVGMLTLLTSTVIIQD